MISNLQFHQLHSDCLHKQNQQNCTYTKRYVIQGKCWTLIYTYFIKNSWKSEKSAPVNLWNFKYSSNTFATLPRLIYFLFFFPNMIFIHLSCFVYNRLKENDRFDMIVTSGKGWLTFPETRLNGFKSNAFRDFFATPHRREL